MPPKKFLNSWPQNDVEYGEFEPSGDALHRQGAQESDPGSARGDPSDHGQRQVSRSAQRRNLNFLFEVKELHFRICRPLEN